MAPPCGVLARRTLLLAGEQRGTHSLGGAAHQIDWLVGWLVGYLIGGLVDRRCVCVCVC